ncbi:thiamine pyrophosphate-binding protein [Nitratifractor salsuginis]|uniref:Thiamine pyrophosphate central domain-containing protein n=1 Tax=Nitratifractor salsuginis (strain DSM 16511 / JCM 12458 / E9I37-1) TaxID=749222 RepID=E6X2Z2_NITSE|nr:thiamine pyrophosphate-binding protein [Nitratifractor salsuginis]ADV47275.1 thiamine pyrophosphate central domain-containing protein [Nitratifractor salsuginis DSM 16511]
MDGHIKKVSDIVAEFLAENEQIANDIFMVSGGGNMHLIDSIGRNERLNYICNHHEQACAIAAEGYARVTNKVGVAMVTTGPGGTNAITGVYGAWVDSIPTLTISGQVKFETTVASQPELKLRQLGDQEINIIDVVKPITKYAVMATDKYEILYHLQKAVYEAKSGRPGPVWVDIPLDIQGANVDEKRLKQFVPPAPPEYDLKVDEVVSLLKQAERPVIIAGNGITLSGANEKFLQLAEKLGVPVVGTFARYDIVKTEHPLFFGRYGTVGHRMANFTVQNADLVLAIGARMNIRAISYNWEFFAREAIKIAVDIDPAELRKHTLEIDVPIEADAKVFIEAMLERFENENMPKYDKWIEKCLTYKKRYPTIEPTRQKIVDTVDSYNFFDLLSDMTADDTVFVFGNGTACVSSYQSLKVKGKQKVVVNSGCASMGYDLPAAIGAAFGSKSKQIVCVTGEGSLQMNLQELQTIIHHRLPVKLFVLNNAGYISIRNTQNNFFKGHKVGSDASSGVSFPDTLKLAEAYGFRAFRLETQLDLVRQLENILRIEGPVICEVMLSPTEKMEPKLSSEVKPDGTMISKPLEDMFPFLDRKEFFENMIIEPVDE